MIASQLSWRGMFVVKEGKFILQTESLICDGKMKKMAFFLLLPPFSEYTLDSKAWGEDWEMKAMFMWCKNTLVNPQLNHSNFPLC